MTYAKKVDQNQAALVAELRQIGASILHLHTLGKGAPDILIGYRGINTLLEIKSTPTAKLTPDEANWHALWRGQLLIVRSIEEALAAVGAV